LILATLFLNFTFCYARGDSLWLFIPRPLYATLINGIAALVAALFFIGPALATFAARRPLFEVIANSLGSVPAFGARLCCVLFSVLWLGALMALPALWWSRALSHDDVSFGG